MSPTPEPTAKPSPAPPTPPAPRADGALSRRLRDLGVSGRRLRRGWTRERLKDIGFTLVYVVPLTLLIWVWAQDQQIETAPQQNVSVAINHTDAQKVVTLLGTDTNERLATRANGAVLVNLTLQGPRVGLNAVLRKLRDDGNGTDSPFKVDLRGGPTPRTAVALRERLAESPLLRDAGVGVIEVTPADVIVSIEEKVQVQAQVVAGGDLPPDELAAPPVFDPATVTLLGPRSTIARLTGPDGKGVVVADLPPKADPGEQTQTVPIHLPDRFGDVPNVSLSRQDVKATFTRKQKQQKELELDPVALVVAKPAIMEKDTVGVADVLTLTGLTVEGPSDAIDALRRDQSAVQAVVTLQRYDDDPSKQPIRRRVWLNLPEGVTLKGTPPEVSVTVQRRGGGAGG